MRIEKHRRRESDYVSSFTQFMDMFLENHPEVVEDQRLGWRIFWDRQVNFDELRQANEDSIPVKGYDYF